MKLIWQRFRKRVYAVCIGKKISQCVLAMGVAVCFPCCKVACLKFNRKTVTTDHANDTARQLSKQHIDKYACMYIQIILYTCIYC